MAKTSGRIMAKVIQEEMLPEYFDMDMVTQGQVRWALNAAAFDMEGHSFPEGMRDTLGCEGVDPDGMYCKENMDYVHRAQQVQLRAKMGNADPSVQRFVQNIVGADGEIELQDHVIEASENKRLYTRAAKRAGTQDAKDVLTAAAEAEGKEIFRERNLYLESMEYAVGIRQEPLTDAHREMVRMKQGSQVANRLDQMAEDSNTHIPPYYGDELTVKFADFDNTLRQRFLAHPSNYSKSIQHAPNDYKTPAIAEADATIYAKSSVAPTMDALFQGVENKLGTGGHKSSLGRGSLIVVNGKTIDEHLLETQKTMSPDQYNNWYRDNVKEKTNELVGAALASGGQVDVYRPDEHGDLPKTPVSLKREGYEPSPLKPVAMRGWQRFFNKFGMFKGKKLAEENYQAEVQRRAEADQAMKDAGERVQEMGTYAKTDLCSAKHAEKQFFEEPITQTFGDRGLRVERTAHVTGARSLLLSQGHSVEDVFDNTKLLEEKRAAGNTYMDMAKNPTEENWEKIGKVYAAATVAVEGYMDERHKTVDFTDVRNEPDFATLKGVNQYMFDMFQERHGTKVIPHYLKDRLPDVELPDVSQSKEPDRDMKTFEDAHIKSNESVYFNFYNVVEKSDKTRLDLHTLGRTPVDGQRMNAELSERMVTSTIQSRWAENPDCTISEIIKGDEMIMMDNATSVNGFRALGLDEDMREQFAKDIKAGKLDTKLASADLAMPRGCSMDDIFNKTKVATETFKKNELTGPAYTPPAPAVEPASKKVGLKGLEKPKTQDAAKHTRETRTKHTHTKNATQNTAQKGGRGM